MDHRLQKERQYRDYLVDQKSQEREKQHQYKNYLDQQAKYNQQQQQFTEILTKKEGITANANGGGMVPGIHNLSTVGSSPLKRGVKTLADNKRDYHYMN